MHLLLYAFLGGSLINLLYYFGFLRFALRKPQGAVTRDVIPVSVIICAKNEAQNLEQFLPSILAQDHPDFEVILINDASRDHSLKVMKDFRERDSRIQIVDVRNIEAFWANKKYALTLGIKRAANPYLLFTDADCAPESRQWISKMCAGFEQKKSIVLGYGGYFRSRRSLLNKLIRFETLLTAIQYFSYALWGAPYMGVGRNLAYTSKEFYRQNGFAGHLHLRSGDDDLFVNEAATKENTAVCFSHDSITRSVPKKTFRDWVAQKRRHTSVAHHYKFKHRFFLGLFYSSQLLFWGLFIILMFGFSWKLALGVFVIRLLLQTAVFYNAGKKLKENDLLWLFPFLELFLVCAQLGIFISNIISKPTHWK